MDWADRKGDSPEGWAVEVVMRSFRLMEPPWLASIIMRTETLPGVLEDFSTAPRGDAQAPDPDKRHSRGRVVPMLNVVPAAISASSWARISEA